jgi:hypothetical protein
MSSCSCIAKLMASRASWRSILQRHAATGVVGSACCRRTACAHAAAHAADCITTVRMRQAWHQPSRGGAQRWNGDQPKVAQEHTYHPPGPRQAASCMIALIRVLSLSTPAQPVQQRTYMVAPSKAVAVGSIAWQCGQLPSPCCQSVPMKTHVPVPIGAAMYTAFTQGC